MPRLHRAQSPGDSVRVRWLRRTLLSRRDAGRMPTLPGLWTSAVQSLVYFRAQTFQRVEVFVGDFATIDENRRRAVHTKRMSADAVTSNPRLDNLTGLIPLEALN